MKPGQIKDEDLVITLDYAIITQQLYTYIATPLKEHKHSQIHKDKKNTFFAKRFI